MHKTNLWVSMKNIVVIWRAHFPHLVHPSEAEILLDIMQKFMDAGQAEGAFLVNVRKNEAGQPYADTPAASWIAFAKDLLEREQTLPFCTFSGVFSGRSRIAYFDEDGQVVEEDVASLKPLLKRLRAGTIVEEMEWDFMQDQPPIEMFGHRFDYRLTEHHIGDYPRFTILLSTDIWFPKVRGWGEDDLPPDFSIGGNEWYYNRELALRHTPRFNRFITALHQITLEAGGEWEYEMGSDYPEYGFMCHEDGIYLDQ